MVVVVAEDNLLGLGLGGARTDVPVVVAEVHLLCGGERLPQLIDRTRRVDGKGADADEEEEAEKAKSRAGCTQPVVAALWCVRLRAA